MHMGLGGLANEITDEDFDYGDEDLASPKLLPSRAITPSEASIKSSEGTPMATTMKRRAIRVSDTSYVTYRETLYFLYAGKVPDLPTSNVMISCLIVYRLYLFTPLIPLERRTSRDPKDPKDNMNIAGSDALSDFDPSELTFTRVNTTPTLPGAQPDVFSTIAIRVPTCTLSSH